MDSEIYRNDVRKLLKWGAWAVLILAIFLGLQTLNAFKTLRTSNPVYNSISITGRGEAVTVPDIASFSFTVSADAKTVSDAQATVTTKMNAILDSIKAQGIDEKDIKTSDYSIWPKYTYQSYPCNAGGSCMPSRQVADGYTVNHGITLKIRKTDNAGKILALVGEKGATNVSGINFTNDDPDAAQNEARANAIDDARSKAEELADRLGVKLVRVVGYYDNQGSYPIYAESLGSSSKTMDSVTPSVPSVPTGENKVVANVTVNYEIR